MRTPLLSVAVVAGCLAFGFSAGEARGQDVAVVDVQHIFKNHYWFDQQMNILRKQVKQSQADLIRKRQEIQDMESKLEDFRPGTPEYRDLERKITVAKADFTVQTKLQQNTFLEEEAKIYYRVYTEIVDAVAAFARQNKVSIVLRYTRNEDISPANPASIKQWIANPVIFQNKIDITERIVQSLQQARKPEFKSPPQ